jgi:glycosyltransferase involved in cell wall biosynthesis
MKVSFSGAPEYMDRNVGFGEASYQIFQQFNKQGIQCEIGDPSSKIGIAFVMPNLYKFARHQYKIGYTPWESTAIPESWKEPLKSGIDEFWATSEWNAEIFRQYTDKPIFVYKHGITDEWVPRKRSYPEDRPFRFLHIGEPAFRKDGQAVVDAFIDVFGNNPKYELIMKTSKLNTTKYIDKTTRQVYGSPNAWFKNIKSIDDFITREQWVDLYDACDAFVYPSWGEGFGFNPLQAMAQGMPTICTAGWATYAEYITAPLNSQLVQSPWDIHPGKALKPDYEQLRFYMRDVAENYEAYSDKAYKNAFLIHKDYNWDKVSKPAVARLKEIQDSDF